MNETKVAIVGCGPKGLYALDSLCEVARRQSDQYFIVHLFEPSNYPGAGPVYDPRQPEVLRMNFPARLINAWTNGRGPSFMDWAALSSVEPNAYVPRARVGEYLMWSFARVVLQAPSNITITRHAAPVTQVRQVSEDWILSPGYIVVDQVLITTGHQDGFRQSHQNTDCSISSPFPIQQRLTPGAIPAGATVRCKGFALTFIDTMLALTEGRGGVFTPSGTGYRYTPSGEEPLRIAPFARSGRPMRAKVEHALFNYPKDDAFWLEQSAELSQVLSQSHPLTFTHHIWPTLLSFADQAFDSPAGTTADFLARRLKTAFTPEQIRRDLRIGYEIAMGGSAPDLAWVLGEVWRRCYAQLVDWISHRALEADDANYFRYIAWEMERLAFGPPAQNIGKMLSLEQAGIVVFEYMAGEVEADISINATIPPAGAAALAAPLDGLLRDGYLSVGILGGVMVDENARALTPSGATRGLSVIGRATEGCVLGNDTLSRRLHSLPEKWAAFIARSARQTKPQE
ncbi:MAG: FAD/NAD(P)-binding protein [Thalassolituus sp.]|jgi:diaminopimelate decarboxylase